MTEHIKMKRRLRNLTKFEFTEILNSLMLSDRERLMMEMYYIEQKPFEYIADILGYSKVGICKMHQRVLRKVERLI